MPVGDKINSSDLKARKSSSAHKEIHKSWNGKQNTITQKSRL